MSRPATFSHKEAARLYATGRYTQAELGARFGVSQTRISQVVDPERKKRVNRNSAEWCRLHYHENCRDCGKRIWKKGNRPNQTGLCLSCFGKSRQTAEHGTEGRYTNWKCRCDLCRRAAADARARRRRANPEAYARENAARVERRRQQKQAA